ncbi:Mannan endo-1,4-beta-mannosidase 2 [Salvia divinorum]|uniref:mannan endo-1,4-beta-mannosidase n=1 Tax=Salvia divinorum TaxID=28513 RepID=A0ABD1GF57_SALDI
MGSTASILAMFLLLEAQLCRGRMLPSNPAFVRRDFVLDGSPFLFNGFNAYWMMNVASDPGRRHKVSDVFREASAAGLTVCRTWAFGDGGDRALQISPGVYDERVFQGLDFVIYEARKYGIRLILSFVNNFNDFGGKAQYVEWARNAGAQASGDDDFYTNPLTKDYYKNHVRRVVTRLNTITRVAYKEEPTIMAWELINEPRCQTDYSGKTLNGWVQEMATFVKSIDNNHLLEIGMEGFYGASIPQREQLNPGFQVGTDFITNNLVKEIDFATIHAYPDMWLPGKSEDEKMEFTDGWIRNHYEDARNILKKPLVIAEFGKSNKYGLEERDMYMRDVYRDIYRYARSGGAMSGSMVWHVMAEGMDEYHDGYEIILSQSPSTAGIMSRQSHAMNALMSHNGVMMHDDVDGHHVKKSTLWNSLRWILMSS